MSGAQLLTMANQALTVNVTEQVRCDSCHGLSFANLKIQRTFGVAPQGQIWVSGVPVLEAAVEAKNGRVYVLDGVLTPPSILPLLPHRCDSTESKVVQVRVPPFWWAAVCYMLNLASAGQTVLGCPLAPPGARL